MLLTDAILRLHMYTRHKYVNNIFIIPYHATLKEVDTQRISSTHLSLVSYCTHYRVAAMTLADPHCPVPSVYDQPLDQILTSEYLGTKHSQMVYMIT